MEEEIEVDKSELIKQIKENAEKEGIVVKLWLENMDFDEFMEKDGGVSAPLIQIDAHASNLTHAAVCLALEDVIEKIKKSDPTIGLMLEALKRSRCGQREVDMGGE